MRREHGWRVALVVSGVALAVGGALHPPAVPGVAFNEHTAAMLTNGRWVPSHALMLIGVASLLVGLILALRTHGDCPRFG